MLKVILFVLYSSSALPCIDNSSQFCVISKFHQQTPSFCALVINQTLNRPHYRTWVALLPDSCAHTTKLLIPHCGPPQPHSTAPQHGLHPSICKTSTLLTSIKVKHCNSHWDTEQPSPAATPQRSGWLLEAQGQHQSFFFSTTFIKTRSFTP